MTPSSAPTARPALNPTHDPARRSWVASANAPDADFPIQNLPLGVFSRPGEAPRGGVAIGDQVLDLGAAEASGLLAGEARVAAQAASGPELTPLLALGLGPASALRARLSDLLREDGPDRAAAQALGDRLFAPLARVGLHLPVRVRQFSDMCCSTFHIGRRRGVDARGQPVTPAMFRRLPVGYDGRASSVVVSGAQVRRPNGQWLAAPDDNEPCFGPERQLDYELELGMWVGGAGNRLGEPIAIQDAPAAIFGFCLLNDWSARGVQFYESMLGPFLGKSLATTVSPWIVTAEAMAPFAVSAFERPPGDPPSPPHLHDATDQARGGLDIELVAAVATSRMRAAGEAPFVVAQTNFRHMYWTWAQMLTHHASNGCGLAAGDLLGSGTCSGPSLAEAACLLEKAAEGTWSLPNGEQRLFLEDGDEVVLRGRAQRPGFMAIGFGEARGDVSPAPPWPR